MAASRPGGSLQSGAGGEGGANPGAPGPPPQQQPLQQQAQQQQQPGEQQQQLPPEALPDMAAVAMQAAAAAFLLDAAQRAGINLPAPLALPPLDTLRITVSNGDDSFHFHVPMAALILLQRLSQLALPEPAAAPEAAAAAGPAPPALATPQPATPRPRTAPPRPPLPDTPQGAGASSLNSIFLAGQRANAAAAAAGAQTPPRPGAPPAFQLPPDRRPWCYLVTVAGPIHLQLRVPASEQARQVLAQLHAVRCGPSARERQQGEPG